MKTSITAFNRFRKQRVRGVALLLVLGALVLLSAITVGFLAAVRQDRTASAFYSDGAVAKQHADTAVNLVIAQLADATSSPNAAWISQPGLVRTYSPDGAVAAYKLYSSDEMKVMGEYDPAAAVAEEVPANWPTRPDEFVDLNRPISIQQGTPSKIYPIVDPTVVAPTVEGFTFTTPDGASADSPLPMPVKWIYVLGDGSLVSYADASKPGKEVVGRVGFWADDETSKVNLNTAAGGVYYDTPSYGSTQDYWMAFTQPVAQEYQRFPGHPSTTSISALFPGLRSIPDEDLRSLSTNPNYWTLETGPASRMRAAARLTPRISSLSATDPTKENGGSNGGMGWAWLNKNAVFPDSDRLLASVDELAYGRRYENGADNLKWLVADNRVPAKMGALPNAGQDVDMTKLGFFATTDSRSPELNLLNRPRIALWPFNKELVQSATDWSKLTPEDRLIRFSSEVGVGHRKLYFQRSNAWSVDEDYASIPENQDVYGYLQWMTSQSMPSTGKQPRASAGASFASKYSESGRDEILTLMFDYLRSMVNVFNYSYLPVSGPTYSFPQKHALSGSGDMGFGFNDITPLQFTPTTPGSGGVVTKGTGTYPVLSSVAFQFYNAGEYLDGQSMDAGGSSSYGAVTGTPKDVRKWVKDTSVTPAKWTWLGSDASPQSDSKPDYVIRRMRLVCLLNFIQPLNSVSSANGRVQVKISGTPFSLHVSAGSPVEIRQYGATPGPWGKSVSNIGFPSMAGTSTLVYSTGGDWDGQSNPNGSYLGMAAPMMFTAAQWPWNGIAHTQTKTFDNDPLGVGVKKRYSDGGTISSDEQRLAQIYPFVSDYIEVKIPYTGTNATISGAKSESPFYFDFEYEDAVTGYNVTEKKSPKLLFSGSVPGAPRNLKIELFPGLDNVNGAYKDVWNGTDLDFDIQSQSNANRLMTTDIEVADCEIPVPLLGDLTPTNTASFTYGQSGSDNWPHNSVKHAPAGDPANPRPDTADPNLLASPSATLKLVPSYKDFQWYPQRFRMRYKEAMFLVQRRGANRAASAPNLNPSKELDVFRSYYLDGTTHSMGDLRLAQLKGEIPTDWWKESDGYQTVPGNTPKFVSLSEPVLTQEVIEDGGNILGGNNWWELPTKKGRLLPNKDFNGLRRITTSSVNGAYRKGLGGTVGTTLGDFTTGMGSFQGGAGIIGPDTGAIATGIDEATYKVNDGAGPYYAAGAVLRAGTSDALASTHHRNFYGIVFSPWKQMPSAVRFGTLPSRSTEATPAPWETLLFSPNPNGGATTHRGWMQAPRDHYFLDLFYMPVVEPYAITENFATNGKINLNYQIAPFTYINRQTGIYALLREMKISAVSDAKNKTYAIGTDAKYSTATTDKFRLNISVPETLVGFQERFAANDPFVSASEICEMFLVPEGASHGAGGTTIKAYWNDKNLTGDNQKESPYNQIYPRVTTRSNSFKVHFVAQTLKGKNGNWQVTGQYRGSQMIERYLDIANRTYGTGSTPSDKFPALAGLAPDGDPYYRFRKLGVQQFTP